MQPVGELQETTPATPSKLEHGAEGPYELEAVEPHATAPSRPASEHSQARSASSLYVLDVGVPPPSSYGRSEDSLARARLSSLSSIQQFCDERFNLSWTRSHSATDIFERGLNPPILAMRRAPVMEHQGYIDNPPPYQLTGLIPPPPPSPRSSSPWLIDPAGQRALEEAASDGHSSEPGQALRDSEDRQVRGRDLLGIRKWAKGFWKSRAHFLRKIRLGKDKNTTVLKDGEPDNNDRVV